jgi:hypothetical protein
MKSTFVIAMVLTMPLFAVSACQNQIQRQESAAESLRETEAGLQTTRAQIDKTLAALDKLLTASPTELETAYAKYWKEVDAMNAVAKETDKDAKALQAKSADYLAKWQKSHAEIQNPELRNASDQRRGTVMSRFDGIQKSYAEARAALVPFMDNLQYVRQVLANDLTPAGVQGLAGTDVVKNAKANGMAMASNLNALKLQYSVLAEVLQPATPIVAENPATPKAATETNRQ